MSNSSTATAKVNSPSIPQTIQSENRPEKTSSTNGDYEQNNLIDDPNKTNVDELETKEPQKSTQSPSKLEKQVNQTNVTLTPLSEQQENPETDNEKKHGNNDDKTPSQTNINILLDELENELNNVALTKEDVELLEEESKTKAITIYGSTVSGSLKIKTHQRKILSYFDKMNIKYEYKDLAADTDAKLFVRRKTNNTNIPLIFVNDEYRADYAAFEEALEFNELFELLGVEPSF